jgi:predicted dinucleotide-binding enzyme
VRPIPAATSVVADSNPASNEHSGIVSREPDPASARSSLVRLTGKGLRLFDEVAPAHLANEDRLLSALVPAERQQLADLLRRRPGYPADDADGTEIQVRPFPCPVEQHLVGAVPAAHGEIVIVSVPWAVVDTALAQAGGADALAGRIVIDTTNQFGQTGGRFGVLDLDGKSAAEVNAAKAPGAAWVKAFNTLTAGFQASASGRTGPGRVVMFYAANASEAAVTAESLITDYGFDPVATGTLARTDVGHQEKQFHANLADALDDTEGVLTSAAALRYLSEDQLRWKISSGRWQKPAHGIIVAQSGPLTGRQLLWVTLLAAGPRTALAGLTAAKLDGLTGFDDMGPDSARPIYLLAPYGYRRRTAPLGLTVVTHYSGRLGDEDVHPAKRPRRTRIARSIVDAASWMATDRGAMAVLAAGVQQRLVRVADAQHTVTRCNAGKTWNATSTWAPTATARSAFPPGWSGPIRNRWPGRSAVPSARRDTAVLTTGFVRHGEPSAGGFRILVKRRHRCTERRRVRHLGRAAPLLVPADHADDRPPSGGRGYIGEERSAASPVGVAVAVEFQLCGAGVLRPAGARWRTPARTPAAP